jgi:hypothetical protein
MSRKTWRCFFCDEVFTSRHEAWLHFGEENCTSDVPACVDPLRTDEKKRLDEVRELRAEVVREQARAEEFSDSKDLVDQFYSELRRYFGQDCNSVWLAGDRYKSALNRISDLESAEVSK